MLLVGSRHGAAVEAGVLLRSFRARPVDKAVVGESDVALAAHNRLRAASARCLSFRLHAHHAKQWLGRKRRGGQTACPPSGRSRQELRGWLHRRRWHGPLEDRTDSTVPRSTYPTSRRRRLPALRSARREAGPALRPTLSATKLGRARFPPTSTRPIVLRNDDGPPEARWGAVRRNQRDNETRRGRRFRHETAGSYPSAAVAKSEQVGRGDPQADRSCHHDEERAGDQAVAAELRESAGLGVFGAAQDWSITARVTEAVAEYATFTSPAESSNC